MRRFFTLSFDKPTLTEYLAFVATRMHCHVGFAGFSET